MTQATAVTVVRCPFCNRLKIRIRNKWSNWAHHPKSLQLLKNWEEKCNFCKAK